MAHTTKLCGFLSYRPALKQHLCARANQKKALARRAFLFFGVLVSNDDEFYRFPHTGVDPD